MQLVSVNASSAYPVYIGGGLLEKAGELVAASASSRTCAVVTDTTVGPLYAAQVCRSLQDAGVIVRLHAFPAGEQSKNIAVYGGMLEFLAESGLTRSDFAVALGGGVAGDMAGFAAAVYLRGIRYVQMPTTLLSAVDVTAGLKKEGALLINSSKAPEELRPLLKGYEGRVCTIDAGKISEEELGKNFPNTPMLAAIVKISGVVEAARFVGDMEASFKHKFASKPQVIEGNMRALRRSMEEVKEG